MSQSKTSFSARTISQATLRRLRIAPSYFFLVWRWSMWLYALIVIIFSQPDYVDSNTVSYRSMATFLLTITFIETLIVTLYAPVIQILFPRLPYTTMWHSRKKESQDRQKDDDGEAEIVPLFAQTRNHYWNVAIYSMDVIICGLVMYYSGPFSNPPFGSGSPFYRYGMSTVFAAASAFHYEGGLIAALGYDLFALLGIFIRPPGSVPYTPNVIDIVGSLIDTPIVAILVAYVMTLLESYARSKRQESENARTQAALVNIGDALLKSTGDRQELLQRSIKPIQRGRFDRLTILLHDLTDHEASLTDTMLLQEKPATSEQIITCVATEFPETYFPASSQALIQKTLHAEQILLSFEPIEEESRGIARLYIPLRKDDHAQIVLAAESKRLTPFTPQHEKFLTIAGTQLLVALDNIRLAEQTAQMAADAERGRIAREIHDGIAQLTYMLSLQAETCEAQALRIVEASEEDAELIMPLAERLGKLVTVSKQALWETRNYMFSLKPLMSGTTTLAQMLHNQLREFEAISDVSTHLHIEGSDEMYGEQRLHTRRYAQIGTTFFRIVQEALTNAYKHAGATRLDVNLRYQNDRIEVDISDNGCGLPPSFKHLYNTVNAEPINILSGHGLLGMQARITELGGQFVIATQPSGTGTIVQASIPL